MAASKQTYLTFNDGRKVPIVGLGTWKSKPGEVTQAVKDAIACGYRHIDCAMAYGNETEVGEGINAKIADGTVKREDLFITSKLWNNSHTRKRVVEALKKSLANLKLDYLDLYLIHWPVAYKEGEDLFPQHKNGKFVYSDTDYLEAWTGMEDGFDQGLTRSIGVSNFNSQQIQRILDNCRIKPVVNQVECHPYLNQKKLVDWLAKKNILVTAYSPLGSPDSPYTKAGDPAPLKDKKLAAVAEKYKKSPAQICIKYQVQRGIIVIPKSVTKSRIEANLQVFDFEISSEDMKTLESLDCNARLCTHHWEVDHPHHPFHIEF